MHLPSLLSLALWFSLVSLVTSSPLRKHVRDKVGYLFIHFYDNYSSPGVYETYPAGEQIFGHLSNGNEALSYKPLKRGAPLLTSNVGT